MGKGEPVRNPIDEEHWYFVDETGDSELRDSRGAANDGGQPCLQVIDYMNWTVYRAFVKQEMRYYRFVGNKVSMLLDLYDAPKYPKNWYSRRNPFDIEKTSPL